MSARINVGRYGLNRPNVTGIMTQPQAGVTRPVARSRMRPVATYGCRWSAGWDGYPHQLALWRTGFVERLGLPKRRQAPACPV